MVLTHIETDGGTLAVEIEGEGPLILCSPGMGELRSSYAPLAEHLVASGFCVARMDARGHGDSSAVFNRYGDEPTAEDFLTVVRKLDKGRAVLAGTSFSAGSATIAAGKSPELVAGIVLLAPFVRNPAGIMGMIAPYMMKIMFMKPWGPFMWNMYAKTLYPGLGDKAGERAATSTASLTRPGRWEAFQKTVAGLDHSVVGPWIPQVQAPVLIVMGASDPDWTDPIKEAEWIASNFKVVENVTVPGAGHAPMLESPELVGGKVLAFVERLRTTGAFAVKK